MSTTENTNQPTHTVFFAEQRGKDQKPFWHRIGAAWENKDGSLNISLNLIPTDFKAGTLQVRVKDQEEK